VTLAVRLLPLPASRGRCATPVPHTTEGRPSRPATGWAPCPWARAVAAAHLL
jgi:hypothetical protein